MSKEVVGSFPHEEWANEVQAALIGKGIDAEVSYHGPRAFTVEIDETDSEKAKEILSDIGYFACSAENRASLSGVLDWLPREAVEEDELREEVGKLISDEIEDMANIGAAEAWSTQPDDSDLPDRYEDPWYLADFDGHLAVNGDSVDGSVVTPEGYVLYHDGRVPVAEQMVYFEHVARAVARHESLNKYHPELVSQIIDDIWKGPYKGAIEIPMSVSGSVEIWAKKKEGHDGD